MRISVKNVKSCSSSDKLKNLFSKIGNGEVVENLFSKKMICVLLKSDNF